MKLFQLITARRLFSTKVDKKLPSGVAYKIMKFLKASDDEEAFYNKQLLSILEKYGVKDSDGKLKVVNGKINTLPDKTKVCQEEINELELTDVNAPSAFITISELEPFDFSIAEMAVLDDFIIEK